MRLMGVIPGYVVKDKKGHTVLDENSEPIAESIVLDKYPGYVHAFRAVDYAERDPSEPSLAEQAEEKLREERETDPHRLNSDTI